MDNANLVVNGLWLGDYESAKNEFFLKENKISFVVNCTKELSTPLFYTTDGIQSVRLPLSNHDMRYNMILIRQCADYIEKMIFHRLLKDENVLIHCAQGRHRSAAIVAYHLMKRSDKNYNYVKTFMKNKRSVVFEPVDPFYKFLKEFSTNKYTS